MPTQAYPILEFDTTPHAMLEPAEILHPLPNMPEAVVLCFFQEVITAICGDGKADIIYRLGSEIGKNPVYRLEQNGQAVAVIHAGTGAPLSAAFMEEAIALGGKKFIACGGAGVLDSSIGVGHVIVPTAAVRDEGTSYHYLPPSREVLADKTVVKQIVSVLEKHHVPHDEGKTWTTDAIYRETRPKVAQRRAEGCICVEMETAAFLAVAQFRGVQFGQLLYGGDDVGGDIWDSRRWNKDTSTREKLFWLAVECALSL